MPTLLINAFLGIIDKIIPDPQAAAAAKLEALKLQQSGELATIGAISDLDKAQIAVNQEDAKGNWFQAGWRPLIGYMGAFGLGYQYLARPLLIGVWGMSNMPPLDGSLIELVISMLGIGGLRTIEKIRGVA